MSDSLSDEHRDWVDSDDAPEWTDEMWDLAEVSIGGNVIRPATGYLCPDGVARGRPPTMGRTKSQGGCD